MTREWLHFILNKKSCSSFILLSSAFTLTQIETQSLHKPTHSILASGTASAFPAALGVPTDCFFAVLSSIARMPFVLVKAL